MTKRKIETIELLNDLKVLKFDKNIRISNA